MATSALFSTATLLPVGMALHALAYFCGACASFGIAYTVTAIALVGSFFARNTIKAPSYPPVTVIKPLRGMETALLPNLVSFANRFIRGGAIPLWSS